MVTIYDSSDRWTIDGSNDRITTYDGSDRVKI